MGGNSSKFEHLRDIESPLMKAQTLKVTRLGAEVNQIHTSKIFTRREVERMRRSANITADVRIILSPPFSAVDRITDSLYLTGVAGLVIENIESLKITCIINATYEMPLATLKGIESFRVPIDDDEQEEILLYFNDVADKINAVSKAGGRTIVHCMAGASRSSSLVIAYLIKYQDYSLKNAFCYLKSMRQCARPNIGFMYQLTIYEGFFRLHSPPSVQIIETQRNGRIIRMPDFYQSMFPDLYRAEIRRQLQRSQVSTSISQPMLQDSNKNYINRQRNYKEMQKDMEKLREEDDTNKILHSVRNPKEKGRPKDRLDKEKTQKPDRIKIKAKAKTKTNSNLF